MGLFFSGTITNYLRTMELAQKWNLKKMGIESPDGESPMLSAMKQANEETKQKRLAAIASKLKSGKKLSTSEMEFLRNNSPDLYRKAVVIQQQREDYKRRLRACKTKDDVQRLNMSQMAQFAGEISAVKGSDMSRGEKQGAIEFIGMQVAAIQDEHMTFVNSGDYERLPWERELRDRRRRDRVRLGAAVAEVRPREEELNRRAGDRREVDRAGERVEDRARDRAEAAAAKEADAPPPETTAAAPEKAAAPPQKAAPAKAPAGGKAERGGRALSKRT